MLSLEYPPNVYGGAGVHVDNLSRALARDIDVHVKAAGDPSGSREGNPSVRFYPMPERYAGEKHSKVLNTMLLDMDIAHDAGDFDLVHSHTWYMAHAAVLTKILHDIPLVATVHSLEPHRPWKREQLGRGYDLTTHLERQLYSMADGIIAVSGSTKKDLLDVYPAVDEDKVTVIHNGIDLERFRPNPDRAPLDELRVPDEYILFVGRLSRQKGIFDLVEACVRGLITSPVVLVTGAADTPELREEFSSIIGKADNILWIDRMLDFDTLRALYTHASVFLCPSRYEPFGIINLEAMACGAPVVASRVGGIPEVVTHGENGLLFEPGDLSAMSSAIASVMDDSSLRKRLVDAGRRTVEERFSWSAIARKTMDFYRKVI